MADFESKLRAVTVVDRQPDSQEYPEHYAIGMKASFGTRVGDITAIEWGRIPGMHCDMMSVVVYMDGAPFAEFPFANCVGVYYAESPVTAEKCSHTWEDNACDKPGCEGMPF